jgi:hypothetical protein
LSEPILMLALAVPPVGRDGLAPGVAEATEQAVPLPLADADGEPLVDADADAGAEADGELPPPVEGDVLAPPVQALSTITIDAPRVSTRFIRMWVVLLLPLRQDGQRLRTLPAVSVQPVSGMRRRYGCEDQATASRGGSVVG